MLYFILGTLSAVWWGLCWSRWREQRKFFPWGMVSLCWGGTLLAWVASYFFQPKGGDLPYLAVGLVLGFPVGDLLAEEINWDG